MIDNIITFTPNASARKYPVFPKSWNLVGREGLGAIDTSDSKLAKLE